MTSGTVLFTGDFTTAGFQTRSVASGIAATTPTAMTPASAAIVSPGTEIRGAAVQASSTSRTPAAMISGRSTTTPVAATGASSSSDRNPPVAKGAPTPTSRDAAAMPSIRPMSSSRSLTGPVGSKGVAAVLTICAARSNMSTG